jgi:acyl dehydratase
VVTKVRARGGVSFVGFDLTVSGTEGDEVAVGSSTFLISGAAPAAGKNPEEPEPGAEEGDLATRDPFIRSVSRAGLIRYAAATRDWNPIHWDHDSARAAGLPGVVVHGLLQAGWLMTFAAEHRSGPLPLEEAGFRFRAPLRPAVRCAVMAEADDEGLNARLVATDTELVSGRLKFRSLAAGLA